MKKIKVLLVISFISLFTTGCWNYNELNDLAITTGIAVDIKDNQYVVSYMIANAKKSQGESQSQEANSVVFSGQGESISSAYQDLNSKVSKIPYISHLEVLIISEEAAKKGVINIVDFLMRNPESRKEFFVILSKGSTAISILETLSPLDPFPSQSIANNILSNQTTQSSVIVEEFSEFISKLLQQGINPILSGIEIEGNAEEGKNQSSLENSKPSAVTKISSIGIFKNDILLGWAEKEESIGINILRNKVDSVLLQAKCDNHHMAATLTNIQTNTEINFNNNNPQLKITVDAQGALVEINCKKNLEDTNVIEELSSEFENSLKNLLSNSISLAATQYKSDIFGYGNMIYKNNLTKWNQIKDLWEEELFPQIDYEIKTNISLSSKGSFEQTILEAKNEK